MSEASCRLFVVIPHVCQTYLGDILLVVNPFKTVPLYTSEVLLNTSAPAVLSSTIRFKLSTRDEPTAGSCRHTSSISLTRHMRRCVAASRASASSSGACCLLCFTCLMLCMAICNTPHCCSGESGAGKTEVCMPSPSSFSLYLFLTSICVDLYLELHLEPNVVVNIRRFSAYFSLSYTCGDRRQSTLCDTCWSSARPIALRLRAILGD